MATKRQSTVLLIYGAVVLILIGSGSFYLAPAWADHRYRTSFADFLQAKQYLEDLATSEWQDAVFGSRAPRADPMEAIARHMDACDEVDGQISVVRKDLERLVGAGGALRGAEKRDLARQLASAATEYADAYQAGVETFCDKGLDAVVALMSLKLGGDASGLRRTASAFLTMERKRADGSAGQIQTIWRRLDGLLIKGFGLVNR